MLSARDGYTEADAIRDATEEWTTYMETLQKEKGPSAYYSNGVFKADQPNSIAPSNRSVSAARISSEMNSVTLANLGDKSQSFIFEEDLKVQADGNYSYRIRYLARKFGRYPREIVDIIRAKRGLPVLQTPGGTAMQAIPRRDKARINSVLSPSLQSAMRAQLRSGQELSGTPEQKVQLLVQMATRSGLEFSIDPSNPNLIAIKDNGGGNYEFFVKSQYNFGAKVSPINQNGYFTITF